MENLNPEAMLPPAAEAVTESSCSNIEKDDRSTNLKTTNNSTTMNSTEVTQQVPVEAAAEKIVYTIPEGMEPYKIYPASVLKAMGYYITTLRINRPLNPIALRLKRKSICDCLGVLTPSLVVSALDCIEKGLEINMPKDAIDLAKVLVILDGAHREDSVNMLNKSKETSFENYYHLPINNNVEIGKTLRAINLVVRPWKGVDLVTSTLIEKADSGVDLSRLTWYQSLCGSMSEKVAWQWASLSTNRPPIKSKVDKATNDLDTLKEIAGVSDQADIDKFNAGKAIFEELNNNLSKEELGWAEIPAFFIKKHSSMTSGKIDTNEAKELLLKYCKTITKEIANSIKGYKGGKGRAENVTRVLRTQYQQFMKQ